jgi:hypothetical protein
MWIVKERSLVFTPSVTIALKLNWPVPSGVPLTTPADESDRPGGSRLP